MGETVVLPGPRGAGRLFVEVLPEGSRLEIDGRAASVPGEGLELPLGAHSLRLAADGFLDAACAIELTAGHPVVRFSTVLRPAPGEQRPEGFLVAGFDVVPPRRLAGTLPEEPGGAGPAVVDVYVRETGEVARVVEVTGDEPARRALADAVRGWRFLPAERGAAKVAARLRVQHMF
jgi:hypothetical protein